ncbi:hypothetical protein BDQ94DRAFT_132239 [Aspergillus welwitschiae]|uniref:Uncharacterized protein n=1 Tax=Aspergillus welwitschiae TaxID=1341132 RepID=A0A3F3QID1_9EURO|nr:hypothetical protein BDQ94DRAFT_132239 [Aspergillus welwitschiae]RDH39038.1 hypothetical protein BDQ94DRAFT_132239 [Aspergillus welwitschiae]
MSLWFPVCCLFFVFVYLMACMVVSSPRGRNGQLAMGEIDVVSSKLKHRWLGRRK